MKWHGKGYDKERTFVYDSLTMRWQRRNTSHGRIS
jgi:hypothetical protein